MLALSGIKSSGGRSSTDDSSFLHSIAHLKWDQQQLGLGCLLCSCVFLSLIASTQQQRTKNLQLKVVEGGQRRCTVFQGLFRFCLQLVQIWLADDSSLHAPISSKLQAATKSVNTIFAGPEGSDTFKWASTTWKKKSPLSFLPARKTWVSVHIIYTISNF